MTANEYQRLASRTIRKDLTVLGTEAHALHGLSAEVGEIHGLYQKTYQGHPMDIEHLKKEIGDCLWFIAELCTANQFELEDIMNMNINKLVKRYPDGFKIECSMSRKDGDV